MKKSLLNLISFFTAFLFIACVHAKATAEIPFDDRVTSDEQQSAGIRDLNNNFCNSCPNGCVGSGVKLSCKGRLGAADDEEPKEEQKAELDSDSENFENEST